jgi:PTH2 family peptidyl-tRNA hydrolase
MVIVMRKFPSLRKGKYIAQACHAALGATDRSSREDIKEWSKNGNTKIVVYVEEERDLYNLQYDCKNANLVSCLIVDEGRTEFNGPTVTALAIGPHSADIIDPITKHLPLF